MALRPVSDLGLIDATDVPPREELNGDRSSVVAPPRTSDAPAIGPRRTATNRPNARPRASTRPIVLPSSSGPARSLADEPTTFVQIMAPGELHERLLDVSHKLAAEHRKLRHQKTILAALVWRYVDPDDPHRIRELGAVLDAYLQTEIAEAPTEIKLGAHLPFSLKYRLDGAALALRRTRRSASAKTLLSALIWQYARTEDLEALIHLLTDYHAASRPTPLPLD
jgi:hypothetical protein